MDSKIIKIKRRGRPKLYSSEGWVDRSPCKSFKILKMCVVDENNNNNNIRPWWIAEFDQPINSNMLQTLILNWKMSNIDNYSPKKDPTNAISTPRGRPRGKYKKRIKKDSGTLDNK